MDFKITIVPFLSEPGWFKMVVALVVIASMALIIWSMAAAPGELKATGDDVISTRILGVGLSLLLCTLMTLLIVGAVIPTISA